jgi:hypothetical protein
MRTSSESLGMGPEELEVGDVICVLLGCSLPVVLRRVNDYSRSSLVRYNFSNHFLSQ